MIDVPPPDVPVLTRPRAVAPRSGDLLVASPGVTDEPWRRCVIAVLEHGSNGTFGLILNKPLDADFPAPDWSAGALRRLYGGPVEPERGLALRIGESPERDTATTGEEPSLTVEVLDMSEPALQDDTLPWLFFAGQAGWMAGQLAAEIARGDWVVISGRLAQALVSEPGQLWGRVLRSAPASLRLWSTLPDDSHVN